MRKNQKGFSLPETVLVIVFLGLISGIGWYVWKANNKSETTNPTTAVRSVDSTTQPADQKEEDSKTTQEYLEVKEWDVRFKLTESAKGSYYKLREGGKYAEVYNSNFDKFKNKDGKACTDEILFIVVRHSENDPDPEDETSPQPDKFINGYGYTGTAAHQSPPECYFVGEDSTDTDEAVAADFTKYKTALVESFRSLESTD